MRLHRHQLAWITREGWRRICDRNWDATARSCLHDWATHQLPLVVTQRRVAFGDGADRIAMGLAAPARWDRRRIAIAVPRGDVLRLGEFPAIEDIAFLLPRELHAEWTRLCARLRSLGVAAHVYGSYGWQALTRLDHLHARSDVDVWIGVASARQADAAAATLRGFTSPALKVDGELVFEDGTATAWREWLAWRAGATSALLVKTIDGSALKCSIDRAVEAEPAQ